MSIETFRNIIWRIANTILTRTYLRLNDPRDPQTLAFETQPAIDADCFIGRELLLKGFIREDHDGWIIWTIARTP
jgi:hypothetical protein